MNNECKPLTKALHTVRVVERVATHLATFREFDCSTALLGAVCDLLGNSEPADGALFDACLAACKRVLK